MTSSSLTRTAVAGVAGAGLAAAAAGQTWATAAVTSPARSAVAQGSDVAPLALPLAIVALAAWGSVLVLRRTGRRVVAVLGLVTALGSAAAVLLSLGDRASTARDALGAGSDAAVTTTAWPFVGALGAVVAAATFAVAVRRAGSWPEMSRRYDAPQEGTEAVEAPGQGDAAAGPEGPSDRDLWRALDEGRDPTA